MIKKFSELSAETQAIAILEFEAQGVPVNLDIPVNAMPHDGNFDWNEAIQPYDFWFAVAYNGEARAQEYYEAPESQPATKPPASEYVPPEGMVQAPKSTAAKAAAKTTTTKKAAAKTTKK